MPIYAEQCHTFVRTWDYPEGPRTIWDRRSELFLWALANGRTIVWMGVR